MRALILVACGLGIAGWSALLYRGHKKRAKQKKEVAELMKKWEEELQAARKCSRLFEYDKWYNHMFEAYRLEAEVKRYREGLNG